MNTIDETIDFVIESNIIHEFPSTKNKKNKTSSSVRLRDESPSNTDSLDEHSSFKSIANTLTCDHESTCSCLTFVRENKNTRGPSNRNYNQKMINKSKSKFAEFFNLFCHYGKTGNEKIIFQSLKKERYDFLELDWQNKSDEYTYHSIIKAIMEVMTTNCPYCLESRFLKASEHAPAQFLTSDCGHSFCVPCFRQEKRVIFLKL